MKTIRLSSLILVSVITMGLNSARADQPHMKTALHHLREARAQLEKAVHNKGEHRERAIDLVDKAIAQVEEGIRFAR